MEIRLPRLWMLRLRTSPHMSLKMENLPMLRYVYYYTVSELPELLDGYVVVQQLQRLLQMPTLRHLQLHDQLPTVNVLAKLQVNCLDLQCLDIGMIVLSFGNIVHLLQALGRLHTFVFAIRNIWTPAPGIDLVRVQALSESVQLLRMYVVGRMRHSPVLLPTEEIVSRLPRLAKIQLQDGIAAMQDFVRRMKAEQRFAWSAAVADRVSIAKVDMLDKQM
ncbi:hypothetical protein IWW55_005057 [Coemansia sp. RSA 2706]|nr:hypothetical protein IWW55_005057 [Coemansia sp. RSA 2706]